MKQKIALAVFLICLGALLFGTLTAFAGTYGDLTYSILDGEVTITGRTASVTSAVIPETIEGYPVTTIGDSAFQGCSSLTTITIPDSVTSIGSSAFEGCTSLTSITIGDSVTTIGYLAFDECTNLTTVKISNLKNWCQISFSYSASNPLCYGADLYLNDQLVEKLEIPNDVVKISEYAFSGSSVDSITIPDSVTTIGDSAFSRCTSLTSITIGDSVTSIGSSAFNDTAYYYNQNNWKDGFLYIGNHLIETKGTITSAIIKEGTKTIGDDAFEGCTSLTSITIPDSVTSIGSSAFSGCTSLTSITIPDSVTTIGDAAFEECTNLTSITIPDGVTSIGSSAFEGCTSLTSVTIGDSVTSIVGYAFYGCTSLTSITIGDSVATIDYSAFYGCKNIKTVYWNAVNIEDFSSSSYAPFKNCSIEEVVFGEKVERIPAYAFYGCTSLTSITIGGSVTTIGSSAFRGCTSLTSITIPDSVTTIGDVAFFECTSLTSITIGDSVTSIGSYAFEGCTSLKTIYWNAVNIKDFSSYYAPFEDCSIEEVVFGEKVERIPAYALYDSDNLTSVTISDIVISIGKYAFSNCNQLTDISVDKDNDFYSSANGVLFDKKKETLLTYPSGKSTAEYKIPNSVTKIEQGAFYDCDNLTLTISKNVTSIGGFTECDNLTINCEKGSYALSYAASNQIPYNIVEIGGPVVTGTAQRINQKIVVYAEPTETVSTQCLHIALYDSNNTMIDYIIVPTIKPFDHTNVVFQDNPSASYTKIFLWDSLESMEPIAQANKIEIQ